MHVVFTFPSFTAVVASFAMTFISEQEIHAHVNFWNCWHCCCIIIAYILTCFMVHTKYFWMSFQVIWSDFYMNRLRQNNCSYWKIWALPIRGEILVLISEISRTIKQKRSAVRNFRKQDNLARYIYRNVWISFSGNFCSISTSLPAFPEFSIQMFACRKFNNWLWVFSWKFPYYLFLFRARFIWKWTRLNLFPNDSNDHNFSTSSGNHYRWIDSN